MGLEVILGYLVDMVVGVKGYTKEGKKSCVGIARDGYYRNVHRNRLAKDLCSEGVGVDISYSAFNFCLTRCPGIKCLYWMTHIRQNHGQNQKTRESPTIAPTVPLHTYRSCIVGRQASAA